MEDAWTWLTTPLPRWADAEATVGLQHRARTTRRALLMAASRLIAEHGYHGTTLNEVTAASGTTKGALYFHFPSKHHLADALVAEVFASWDALQLRIEQYALDPLTTLLVSYDAYSGRLMHDPTARAAQRILRDEPVLDHAARWAARWEKTVESLFWSARNDRCLRSSVDPAWLSRHVLATATGHFHLSARRAGPDMWERMDDTWTGLLPAVASPDWLDAWHSSGWADRPRPTPEQYLQREDEPPAHRSGEERRDDTG